MNTDAKTLNKILVNQISSMLKGLEVMDGYALEASGPLTTCWDGKGKGPRIAP